MRIRVLLLTAVVALTSTGLTAQADTEPEFRAGFAVRDITPPEDMWDDVWHVSRRRPTGVLDPLKASAVYLSSGDEELAIISLDVLGLFYDDIVTIRDRIRNELGTAVNVIVASTHTHSSVDTLGIYGPDQTTNGIFGPYQELVLSRAVDAATSAAADASVATMRAGVKTAPAGFNEYDRNRHPGSMDDDVHVLQFEDTDGAPIGTVVNWASHPEIINPKDNADPGIPAAIRGAIISSDYVHALRETVETHTDAPVVFLNGPVGAVTALAVPIVDPDTGQVFPKKSVKKAYHLGSTIGQTALEALETTTPTTPDIAVRSKTFDLTVDNPFVLALKAAGVVDRQTYSAGVPVPFGRDVRTEMLRVRIGDVEMLTIPGELQPDLYTGGYLPDDEKANPDVPEEKPIEPQMKGGINFVVGLGMDELGYFVSATDYTEPSLWPVYGQGEDRNGVEHYQETLSLGRDTARSLSRIASLLLEEDLEKRYRAYPGGFLTADGRPLYSNPGGDVRGIWVDTSSSGRYEQREDAEVFVPLPTVPSGYGFLDSQMKDMGTTPANGARGVWIDSDGDGEFTPNRDLHLFFDTYMLGEGPLG